MGYTCLNKVHKHNKLSKINVDPDETAHHKRMSSGFPLFWVTFESCIFIDYRQSFSDRDEAVILCLAYMLYSCTIV